MKEQSMIKLKSLMKGALQQFFEQSGINEILLQLYEQSKSNPKSAQASTAKKQSTKVENILRKNAKEFQAVVEKRSKGSGKIQQMKQQSSRQLMQSYMDDQDQVETPMLNALRQSAMQEQYITPHVSANVAMNQNVDPLASGVSVLDANMPNFLMKGLSKLVSKSNK